MSPTETGCGDVLDTVPVSAERQIFGPKYNYGVEVVLPQVFREHKYPNPGCVIAVDPYGQQSMTASWLLVFAAANSVNAMCVRRGKEGLYVANGTLRFSRRSRTIGSGFLSTPLTDHHCRIWPEESPCGSLLSGAASDLTCRRGP